ncbi:hypothetical protein [Parazoarcus communis]|nr:hypothetical protein [Parazoarcus communis]
MRIAASGTHARTLFSRFARYRTLRRFAGPVLAYRLIFGGRA